MEKVENQQFSCKMANRIQKMKKNPPIKQMWIGAWGKKSLPKKKINSANITRGFVFCSCRLSVTLTEIKISWFK